MALAAQDKNSAREKMNRHQREMRSFRRAKEAMFDVAEYYPVIALIATREVIRKSLKNVGIDLEQCLS